MYDAVMLGDISAQPGIYFDEAGNQKDCVFLWVGTELVGVIDAETREGIPNPEEAMPIDPQE